MAKPGKKKNQRVVPGPFDRPYMTNQQLRAEAKRRAQTSVRPLTQIEKEIEKERAGATAITESFADMLARQSAQNLAAQQAIQGASSGAGSALTTGAITGATQEAAGVPLFAAGEGVRLQREVEARGQEEKRARNEAFRKNLAVFEQQVRDEEFEKQASRIEAAAAEKAYGIDLAEMQRKQANEDRNYALALRREERLSQADTGNINDLIPTIGDIAKEASVQKGGGGWQGNISYIDPETGERETLDVSNVQFDPKGKSLKQRQDFWKKYVARAIGADAAMIDSVGTGSLTRGEGKKNPVDVARDLLDYVTALGYTRQEAYAAILKTVWGGANAKAVSAALRG